jgi:hypothetical protein
MATPQSARFSSFLHNGYCLRQNKYNLVQLFFVSLPRYFILLGLFRLDLYSQGLQDIALYSDKLEQANTNNHAAINALLHAQLQKYVDRQMDNFGIIDPLCVGLSMYVLLVSINMVYRVNTDDISICKSFYRCTFDLKRR